MLMNFSELNFKVLYLSLKKELENPYLACVHVLHKAHIAWFQIERGWVRGSLLWDKQPETHIVRKSKLKLATISSLVFVGPILDDMQPFKNFKIFQEIYRRQDDVSGSPYIPENLFNISPIDNELHNLNALFLTMWVSCCLSHNKQTRTQPLSI